MTFQSLNPKISEVDIIFDCPKCGSPHKIWIAARSEAGLEMMMGRSAALASVFSPNKEFTIPISEFRGIICQDCAMGSGLFDVGERVGEGENEYNNH